MRTDNNSIEPDTDYKEKIRGFLILSIITLLILTCVLFAAESAKKKYRSERQCKNGFSAVIV